jgi:hypothetical protein
MAFDLSFLWCLGISLLIIGVLGIYFKNKLTEQEHKITAMFGIVTTMAEQISSLRKQTSHQTSCPVEFTESIEQPKTFVLIPVSDDEEDETDVEKDDKDSDEEKDGDNDDNDTCSTSSSSSSSSDSESEINDIDIDDIKTINIESIDFPLEELLDFKVIKEEDTKDKKENKDDNDGETDYKKMSLGKLRLIVQEKGLVQDASKISKKDLLKMLTTEI